MTAKRRLNSFTVYELIISCLATLLVLTSCIRDEMPPAVRQQVRLGLIDGTDLPFGWGYRSGRPLEIADGYGQSVGFHGSNPDKYTFVLVTQRLEIYSNELASHNIYLTRVDEFIPPAYADVWVQPPEMQDFQSGADEISITCMAVRINGIPTRSCQVIARYGELVTTLFANVFEDRWLTMPQFRQLVERLDQRMQAARVSAQTPTSVP